ncbi:MAG: sulfur oxidation c-type cytochrome SoxA [Proteobacteria bacterium]|jgi:L-cysteine S-thiosulfotransferase|nr:sulfur oxidation c-type cytochrome SoxA [Pseudomonadota bacterium]MCG6935128.1 sulfur oxidation c-type cytochrome SoxA [Pseudomonadota bacterium]
MKKFLITITALSMLGGIAMTAQATPQTDLKDFRAFFFKKFPGVKLQDYGNGAYALDADRRFEWEAMEEFPPYEEGVEIGEKLFTKYNVGKCFKNGGLGIKQNYPYFDQKTKQVRDLERDIMACLENNGVDVKAEGIKYGKGKMAAISAFMAYNSRGKKQNVVISNDPASLEAYNDGKIFFYAKRGQLNFSCADCHMYSAGMLARGNLLSPALGQTSHFPVWRRSWSKKTDAKKGKHDPLGGFGTIQKRYAGCNKQVRAKPFKLQSPTYDHLEYFHTYMSNGIMLNGPAVRH